MSVYGISDLHLSLGGSKPMDVFGSLWEEHDKKIKENWINTVSPGDIVVMPGDFSWATYIEEAYEDFSYLEGLPGKKILLKGNHDYWWTSAKKMREFTTKSGFETIEFLNNNSFEYKGIGICGTRGWAVPSGCSGEYDDEKIYNRELQRLEMSLKSASQKGIMNIIAALHFPPFKEKGTASEFVDLMKAYNVSMCIYGHIHSIGNTEIKQGLIEGIDFRLVSCEKIAFKPMKLFD